MHKRTLNAAMKALGSDSNRDKNLGISEFFRFVCPEPNPLTGNQLIPSDHRS